MLQDAGPSIISIDVASASFVSDQERNGTLPTVGKGAGFLIDSQGHAVTNYHVVADMNELELTLVDGKVVPGVVVGRDPTSDLAVIQAHGRPGQFRPLRLANSGIAQVGETIIAVGDPYGFQRTVSTGIVSGLGRMIAGPDGQMMPSMIQVDASIGPGNSGGPLLNSRGEVIGVVSAKVTGGAQFGFAIPAERVRRVVPDLIATGRVHYAWLGVSGSSVPASVGLSAEPAARRGVLVQRVAAGGPAHLAGLRGPQGLRLVSAGGRADEVVAEGGDVIVEIDGRPIVSPYDLTGYMRDERRPGDTIRLDLLRDAVPWTAQVVLGERPSVEPDLHLDGRQSEVNDDW